MGERRGAAAPPADVTSASQWDSCVASTITAMTGVARLVAVAAAALSFGVGAAGGSASRDDTAWLQALLDAGDSIYLAKLPGGECYQTYGLWVSHDDTLIDSNGACVVSLGPGPVRLVSNDGDPIGADSVFFVNRSDHLAPWWPDGDPAPANSGNAWVFLGAVSQAVIEAGGMPNQFVGQLRRAILIVP